MAFDIIAEWLARIEYKLDKLMEYIGGDSRNYPPMHFLGQTCPICKQAIDYRVDIIKNVVTRHCGCSTGKLPMSIPLTPVIAKGEHNGNPTSNTTRNKQED